jgi:hypothetical protein
MVAMTMIWNFRIIILLILLGMWPNVLFAQEDSDKTFTFVYVAHDMSKESIGDFIEDVSVLQRELYDLYYNIQNGQEDPSVFYLSNGVSYKEAGKTLRIQGQGNENRRDTITSGEMIVIKMYVPGDNRTEFQSVFLGQIATSDSHEVNSTVDLDNILNILKDADFLDDNNQIRYKTVNFEFYVNPQFWENKLHEKLIAALYFVLDADKYDIKFNIHHMIEKQDARPEYWKNQQADFGPWNISNINKAFPKVQLIY